MIDILIDLLRYVNRLKVNDDACAAALQNAQIFLFHRLSPLLHRTEHGTFRPAALVSSGTDRTTQTQQIKKGREPQVQVRELQVENLGF